MTRYTNFARKRTYIQSNEPQGEPEVAFDPVPVANSSGDGAAQPAKKKRKRGPSNKTKPANTGDQAAPQGEGADEGGREDADGFIEVSNKAKFGDKGKKGKTLDKRRPKDANARKFASDQRRLKRIDDRYSDTICFACREKGHTARGCTNTLAVDTPEGDVGKASAKSGRDAVGICYRCGSRRHNLSRCKEPVDPGNPLPFASCFVCSGKGHLASKCPMNQSKGIYPNGGCCKLCKETTHLAKDCPLRKQEVDAKTVFVGTGEGVGADEDDFHTIKRLTVDIDRSEKAEEKAKKKVGVKVGVHSGVVKAFGETPAPKKKVVVF